MMLILDRIEGQTAVLETESGLKNVPRTQLPAEVKEGDVLLSSETGYVIDAAATQARREKLLKKARNLRKQ
jgi:hypothetical protein